MKYFRNSEGKIFAYDLHQTEYIEKAYQTMVDITEERAKKPSQDELDSVMLTSISEHIKKSLNSLAVSWGYNDIYDAISFKDSTNQRLKTEAQLLIAYRDAVKIWSMQFTETVTVKDFKIAIQSFPIAPIRSTV